MLNRSYPASSLYRSLDALERDEEARLAALRVAVIPDAPDPIGVAGSEKAKVDLFPLLHGFADAVDLTGSTSTSVSFWHKYKQEFLNSQQRGAAASKVDDAIMDDEAAMASPGRSDSEDHHQREILPGRLSTGSSMSMNSSLSSSALVGSPAPVFQRW